METNRATEHMSKGYVCSESVLLGVCEEFGFEFDDRIIPRIANLFGGGMGNTGSVCGAVIGGVMALGLMTERGDTVEEMLRTVGIAREFCSRFEAEMGTIQCRELTKGADLITEEGIGRFMASDIPETVCFPAVAAGYRLVVDLLKERT